MKIIYRPRQSGKTTELIEMAAKHDYSLIVCHSRPEADRIFGLAQDMGYRIPLPITYDEFLEKSYYGKHISSFLVDNIDMLIVYLAKNVPVEAITLSKVSKEK